MAKKLQPIQTAAKNVILFLGDGECMRPVHPLSPHRPGTLGCQLTKAGPGNSDLIYCVPSGMGVPTVTATRILKGQMNGKPGPETPLAMDQFPYVALSKVRSSVQSKVYTRGVGVGLGSRVDGKAPGGPGAEIGARGCTDGPRDWVRRWVSTPAELKVSLLPDIQRGQTGARQCRHCHCLPVWGQGQLQNHWCKCSRPLQPVQHNKWQ